MIFNKDAAVGDVCASFLVPFDVDDPAYQVRPADQGQYQHLMVQDLLNKQQKVLIIFLLLNTFHLPIGAVAIWAIGAAGIFVPECTLK